VISAFRDVPSKPLLPVANLQDVMGQFLKEKMMTK